LLGLWFPTNWKNKKLETGKIRSTLLCDKTVSLK
jgi:hypothetical protein